LSVSGGHAQQDGSAAAAFPRWRIYRGHPHAKTCAADRIIQYKGILPDRPKFWAWPKRIHIHFLDPVPTEGMSLRQVEELKNKVHGIMESYFVNNRERYA
jgi:hypothetical protein